MASNQPQKLKRKRVNLYLTENRARLFEKAFDLLVAKGQLPTSAKLERSRTTIVDFALDALINDLTDPELQSK